MNVLFIGGTGTISYHCVAPLLCKGFEVCVFNRGSRNSELPKGVRTIIGDIRDGESVRSLLKHERFDVVVDWLVYTPEHAQLAVELFQDRVRQYVFISSASAYHKPTPSLPITEATPLYNPYWSYSQDKIACETLFMNAYRTRGFPVTIVRPSRTYDERSVPSILGSGYGLIRRMLEGKPVVIPGDGEAFRALTHSSDFAKGFAGLIGTSRAVGEAYTITTDEQITWNAAHRIMASLSGVEAKIVHVATDFIVERFPDLCGPLLGDKINTVVFDNAKIKALSPDFVCTTPFALGMERSLAWFDERPDEKERAPSVDALHDAILRAYLR